MAAPQDERQSPELDYHTRGPVPESVRLHASEMIARLARKAPRPLIFARVKVLVDKERSPDQDSILQATIDVSGKVIRAQTSSDTPLKALQALESRLQRRIDRLSGRRRQGRQRPPSTPEGEWRSGDLPNDRPGYFYRPVEERRIVRRKSYAPEVMTSVAEALFDLEVLDHRFFLFTDEADGKPSIVYETADGVTLRRIDGSRPVRSRLNAEVEVNETPAPTLDPEEATRRLDLTEEPFIFFRDAGQGRAMVLYRRYDGHYGLIEPALS